MISMSVITITILTRVTEITATSIEVRSRSSTIVPAWLLLSEVELLIAELYRFYFKFTV